jgi:hypothetical protein
MVVNLTNYKTNYSSSSPKAVMAVRLTTITAQGELEE